MFNQTALLQAQETEQLGAFIETYQTRTTRSGYLFFWFFILMLLLMYGFIIWLFTFLFNGDNLLFSSLFYTIIGIILPMLGPIILFLSFYLTLRDHDVLVTPIRRKITISLYTGGFIYREGREKKVVPWSRIRLVQRQVSLLRKKQRCFYTVKLHNTDTLVSLPMIVADVELLGNAIEKEMVKQLLPEVLAEYQAGKNIVFPGLCITQQYVCNSEEKLYWSQLSEIRVNKEQLIIKEKESLHNWLAVSVSQIPNLCVLEALLKHIKQEQELAVQLVF